MTRARITTTITAVGMTAAMLMSFLACSANAALDRASESTGTGPITSGPASGAPAGPPPTTCTPARPLAATGVERTFSFGGRERHYLLSTPDGDGSIGRPLLLAFHGYASAMGRFDQETGLAEKGSARGYIVVTPDSLSPPKEWNMFNDPARPDDYAFVDALIISLERELCIDPRRIYAAGHSNGSAFTGFLACKAPYRFAAIAMVSATVPGNCPPDVRLSVVAFHGTGDPQVPYDGGSVGGGPVPAPAAEDMMASRARQDHCGSTPAREDVDASVTRIRYSGCSDGTDVVLYRIEHGPHAWPGSQNLDGPIGTILGVPAALAASDLMLDFFDSHPKATATP